MISLILPDPFTFLTYAYDSFVEYTLSTTIEGPEMSSYVYYSYLGSPEITRSTTNTCTWDTYNYAYNISREPTKHPYLEPDMYYYGYRYYSPGGGSWLSRDPIGEEGGKCLYAMVNNQPINLVDTDGQAALIPIIVIEAMKQFIDCYLKMVDATKDARVWFAKAELVYDPPSIKAACCVDGKLVQLHEYPGCITGEKGSTHGVLHCAAGAYARRYGVGSACLTAANVLWEAREFFDPKYWEWRPEWADGKGFEGWFIDTKNDIDDINRGYFSNPLECIPPSCKWGQL